MLDYPIGPHFIHLLAPQEPEISFGHPRTGVTPLCNGCRNRCAAKITEEERRKINNEVNHLILDARRQWYRTYVVTKEVQVRRPENRENHDPIRTKAFIWTLPGKTPVQVCRPFFLATLGFTASNADAVMSAVNSGGIRASDDRRGQREPNNKLDQEEINQHIKKYHP